MPSASTRPLSSLFKSVEPHLHISKLVRIALIKKPNFRLRMQKSFEVTKSNHDACGCHV